MGHRFRFRGRSRVLPSIIAAVLALLAPALAVPRVVRGAAFADYDNDGDLDVALVQNNEGAVLLRNDSERHGRFLSLHVLDDEGRTSHGVRVLIRLEGREILAQSVPGASYCSSNDARILVGLPDADVLEVEVFWPTGDHVTLRDVKPDSFLRVSPRGAETIR